MVATCPRPAKESYQVSTGVAVGKGNPEVGDSFFFKNWSFLLARTKPRPQAVTFVSQACSPKMPLGFEVFTPSRLAAIGLNQSKCVLGLGCLHSTTSNYFTPCRRGARGQNLKEIISL